MPPAGSLGPPHLRPAGYRNRLRCPETAPLSPRRLPASLGAPGSRVPAAARGPELLWGRDPRSCKAPDPPCASPAPRARLPRAAGRAAAPARRMRPLEAPSDGDTGPPRLLAPPAATSAARGPGTPSVAASVPLGASAATDDLMGEELCPASNCCSKLDGRQHTAGKRVPDRAASLPAGGWGHTDEVVAAETETKCFLCENKESKQRSLEKKHDQSSELFAPSFI